MIRYSALGIRHPATSAGQAPLLPAAFDTQELYIVYVVLHTSYFVLLIPRSSILYNFILPYFIPYTFDTQELSTAHR